LEYVEYTSSAGAEGEEHMKRMRILIQGTVVQDIGFRLALYERADDLGIDVIGEERVSTGAGDVRIKRGRAWLTVKAKEDAFPVWISGVIDKVLLGVVVLESFGFEVDPATGALKERPLLLYLLAPY
jgi:hypothetical protein